MKKRLERSRPVPCVWILIITELYEMLINVSGFYLKKKLTKNYVFTL